MGALNTIRNILGPSQTDHKRLAEIKLTQERLNKKPIKTPTQVQLELPSVRPLGGGAMDLVGGRGVVKGIINLSKKFKGLGIATDILMNTKKEK